MKTEVIKTEQAIREYIDGLSDSELVKLHNEYCREQNYSDDEIYTNDEDFFNTYFEGKTLEAVRAVCFGEYEYQNEYVKFNGYGNLESFNDPEPHVDKDAICTAIFEEEFTPYDIELTEPEEETEED